MDRVVQDTGIKGRVRVIRRFVRDVRTELRVTGWMGRVGGLETCESLDACLFLCGRRVCEPVKERAKEATLADS